MELIAESLGSHVGDKVVGDFHIRRETALDFNILGHKRASADGDIDSGHLALRLALLKAVDYVADCVGGLDDIADAAVADGISELFLLDSLDAQGTRGVDGADGSFDF